MDHNALLRDMLGRVRQQASAATAPDQLMAVFPVLRRFTQDSGPIQFDNTRKWYAALALAVIGGVGIAVYTMHEPFAAQVGDAGIFALLVLGAALLGTLISIGVSDSAIDEISDLIFHKDISFDNSLVTENISEREEEIYVGLRAHFGEFARGDEGRRIERLVTGTTATATGIHTYQYYAFRYVEVYYVPVTRKVGNSTITTMERRTRTCHRYGLLMDFPHAERIAVVSSGGRYAYEESYEPVDATFNDTYDVYAAKAHDAAKLLKPAVVLAFNELATALSGVNVEISAGRRLNIAFSDSDLLHLERAHSIAQPAEFEAEILGMRTLPKLRAVLAFASTLARHNDSNF